MWNQALQSKHARGYYGIALTTASTGLGYITVCALVATLLGVNRAIEASQVRLIFEGRH